MSKQVVENKISEVMDRIQNADISNAGDIIDVWTIESDAIKKSVTAVIEQGRRSVGANGKYCRYINGNGDRCAIGHIIDFDKIDTVYGIEGKLLRINNVVAEAVRVSLGLEHLDDRFVLQLRTLQVCHDEARERPKLGYDSDPAAPAKEFSFVESFSDRIRHQIKDDNLPRYLLKIIK